MFSLKPFQPDLSLWGPRLIKRCLEHLLAYIKRKKMIGRIAKGKAPRRKSDQHDGQFDVEHLNSNSIYWIKLTCDLLLTFKIGSHVLFPSSTLYGYSLQTFLSPSHTEPHLRDVAGKFCHNSRMCVHTSSQLWAGRYPQLFLLSQLSPAASEKWHWPHWKAGEYPQTKKVMHIHNFVSFSGRSYY